MKNEKDEIVSVSHEAYDYGVRAGHKLPGARALCPGIIIRNVDAPTYSEAAHVAWDYLATESNFVEPDGYGRCFVQLSGTDQDERLHSLYRQVARQFECATYMGAGRTKLISRLAAEEQRELPHIVLKRAERRFLSPIPISRLIDTADQRFNQLQRLGIQTLGDVLELPEKALTQRMGQAGSQIEQLARGFDGCLIKPCWPITELVASHEFEMATNLFEEVCQALSQISLRLSSLLDIRVEYARHAHLLITCEDSPDPPLEATENLVKPLRSANEILTAGVRLFHRLSIVRPIQKIELQLSRIATGDGIQLALFNANESLAGYPIDRERRLVATTAYLGQKYGEGAVECKPFLSSRTNLWASPLGKKIKESIQVHADPYGTPIEFCWRGKKNSVVQILDSWVESQELVGIETRIYRFLSERLSIGELRESGGQWSLAALAD